MTLIEILTALVIISIVIMTLFTIFVQSAKTNQSAKNRVDSTYIAEMELESIYNLARNTTLANSSTKLNTDLGYTKITTGCPTGHCYAKQSEDRYVFLTIKPSGAAVIKVFKDDSKQKLEAQMELLISWKQT